MKSNKNPLSKRVTGTSKDYDLFLPVIGNRPINERHVMKLVDSIRNNGNISSITCRQVQKDNVIYYEILDGQHRVEALKILELPVEYDCWDISNKGMIALNENQKNWSPDDYLNFGVKDGLKDYITLNKYKEESGMSLTPLLEIFGSDPADPERAGSLRRKTIAEEMKEFGVRHDSFKRLEWTIPNLDRSVKLLNMLKDFYDRFNVKHWKSQRFVAAFLVVANSPEYDHERMMLQMEKCSKMLRKQASQSDYIENIEDIYNRNLGQTARVRFKRRAVGQN